MEIALSKHFNMLGIVVIIYTSIDEHEPMKFDQDLIPLQIESIF